MPSWEAWARTTRVSVPEDRLYLIEIARWADARGVAHLATSELRAVAGRSRQTVSNRLGSLQKAGLIHREQLRRKDGTHGPLRIQLLRKVNHEAEWQAPSRSSTPHPFTPSDACPDDDESLREALLEVADDQPGSRAQLGGILATHGPRRFASIIRRRNPNSSGADAADTIGVAYELAVRDPQLFAQAERPWALLATYLRTRATQIDQDWWNQDQLARAPLPDDDWHEMRPLEARSDETPTWGLDELNAIPQLELFVEALIDAGMSPTLAECGTSKVLAYLASGKDSRHHLIGHDTTLAALGVAPDQARAWLTAIGGSRRGKGGLGSWSDEEIIKQASALVAAIQTTSVA